MESLGGYAANHLQGNVRAVEDTSVISVGALVASNVVLISRNVGGVRVNEDLQLAVDSTSEQVTLVVNVQVSVQSGGVVKNTCHGECRSNVSRTDDQVTLATTSLLGDGVTVTLNLEQKTLELLNAPATVRVNVEVENTGGGNVGLSALNSRTVNGANNLTVDLSQDLAGQDVSQLGFSVKTVDSTQVLSKLQAVLSLQGTAFGFNDALLDREAHLAELVAGLTSVLEAIGAHTAQSGHIGIVTGGVEVAVGGVGQQTRIAVGRSAVNTSRRTKTSRESRVGFVEHSFVRAVRTIVQSTHGEDQSSRTGHRLNATDVVCHQVRHSAADKADHNGVETSVRTTGGSSASEAVSTNRLGGGFGQKASALTQSSLLTEETFLVFEELSSDSTTERIFDLVKTLMIQYGCPLFGKMLRHCLSLEKRGLNVWTINSAEGTAKTTDISSHGCGHAFLSGGRRSFSTLSENFSGGCRCCLYEGLLENI